MREQPSADNHACFIINSHKPYCFDLNEILALPAGFRFRNRFDTRWVRPSLRGNVDWFVGKRVLLTLRDIEHNTLIPARWATIVSAIPVGDIFYFEYILGDLIRYNTAAPVRVQEIAAHTEIFRGNHEWLPGEAGKPLIQPSVFDSNVGAQFPTAPATDLTAWGSAVSAVATAPCYLNVEFLKIVGLYSSDLKPAQVSDESYLMSPDAVYTLRVFQHIPAPSPTEPGVPAVVRSHDIELQTFPEQIIALRSTLRAVGRYDLLTFVIKTLSLRPGDKTAMQIPHSPDAAADGIAVTSLYIPITIIAKSHLPLIIALVLAAVSLYFMFEPHVASADQNVIRNLATVLFVLTIAGPSRTLASFWPTLPWKV